MPTYSYACTACEHRFDAQQAFTDEALTSCPQCGGRLRKLFGNVGVVFKGSGFYRTDARAGATAGKAGSGTGTSGSGTSGTSSSGGSGAGASGAGSSGTSGASGTSSPAPATSASPSSSGSGGGTA